MEKRKGDIDMNTVCIVGNLVRDPELKTTPTGKSVCKFTVAVNGIKSKNTEKQRADFIPCVSWDAQAENIAKYLRQGNKVAIKGSLRSGSYDKDGQKRYTLEVELDKYDGINFLTSANGKQEGNGETESQGTITMGGFTAVETDELPF